MYSAERAGLISIPGTNTRRGAASDGFWSPGGCDRNGSCPREQRCAPAGRVGWAGAASRARGWEFQGNWDGNSRGMGMGIPWGWPQEFCCANRAGILQKASWTDPKSNSRQQNELWLRGFHKNSFFFRLIWDIQGDFLCMGMQQPQLSLCF